LVAMDAVDDNEILLIDERGCPTDPTIMGVLAKSTDSNKILITAFDAFKFPTSDKVQFRALVTPCLPACEPVQCDVIDFTGDIRMMDSYGRRKRDLTRQKRDASAEELLVVQTIEIVDKFNPALTAEEPHPDIKNPRNYYSLLSDKNSSNPSLNEVFINERFTSSCINTMGIIIAGALFLAAQLLIIVAWVFIWLRKKRTKELEERNMVDVAMSSLHQLYNHAGYTRRL